MKNYSILEKIGLIGVLLISVLNIILLFTNNFTIYIFVLLLPFIVLIWAGRDFRKNKK
jgi:uncharacterized membrane protein